jgi:hypothetical protein
VQKRSKRLLERPEPATTVPPQPSGSPKSPLEAIFVILWSRPIGRVIAIVVGILAVIALASQGIDPIIKLFNYVLSSKTAKLDVPEYVKDGYYVETRRTVFDLGSWREVAPAQENVKTSLAICTSNFTIYRQKSEAVNFVHHYSSTAKVAPEVFSDRTFTILPVEGYTELGKPRIWEIRIDISNEPLHKPINLQFVIFFWNNFNRKDQWDVGTRIYNSRTDLAEIAIRFPHWKPVPTVNFETRSPIGDKSQTQTVIPDPARVVYEKDQQGNILGCDWTLEQPSGDKTYWMTWDWTSKSR